MSESLSEISSNLDTLEASDEGKKKSKLKSLKSLFVKKKRKETEDPEEHRMLRPSFSSSSLTISSLELIQEGESTVARSKSSMGNKALSHESIFMSDTELEISASEISSSRKFRRSKTLRRSKAFKILTRSRAVSGSTPRYVPRSGVWVADSKITEIPPLHPCQRSLSPPLIQSDKISKEFEEFSVDDELPDSQEMKVSSHKLLTAKKSFSESSSGSDHSQPSTECASASSDQQLAGFSTQATSQSCLDSSTAQRKMALNSQKQQKKSLQATVEANQEEPNLSVVSEGAKSPTKVKEISPKKVKIESEDPSDREQIDHTRIYHQQETDKPKNANAAGNLRNPASAAHGRRRKRTGTCASATNQHGLKGRSFIQFSKIHGLDNRAMSSSTNKTARGGPSWHLPSEKQAVEHPATLQAEITTPLEMLSDKSDVSKDASVDFEAKKALAPQLIPEHTQKSMVSGPQPNHEDGATVTEKIEPRSLLPMVGSPSRTQKKAFHLVTTEAQVLRDPSPGQSEEEEASHLGLQNDHSETENVPTICKEKPPGNVLQDCTVSFSGTTNATAKEGGISMEKPKTENVSPDSKGALEKGSDSEKQPGTEHSFQSLKKPKDKQAVFQESKNLVVELSGVEQQRSLGYSSQVLRKPEAEKGSSESESTSNRKSGSKEVHPAHASQSSGKHKGIFSESNSFVAEQLAPKCPSEAVLEPENKEISTESNSYVKKYNSAEVWHSSEEGLPLRSPNQALKKSEDEQDVPSVPENAWKERMLSKCPTQSVVRPIVQQHISSSSVSVCARQHGSVEPVTPSHRFQPWVKSKLVRFVSAGQDSAVEWGSFTEPLPHKKTSNYLMNPKVEQKSPSGPKITSVKEVSMEVLPSRYSQPPTRAIVEQEASEYPDSTHVERRIFVAPRHPSHPFQPWMSPQVEKQVFSSPEKGGIFVKPLPAGHLPQPSKSRAVQQSMSLGSESVAADAISVKPRYSKYSLPSPQTQPVCSENTAVEQGTFVEQLPRGHHCQPLVKPKFQPQMSLDSASTSAQWGSVVEALAARHTRKIWMCSECKQQVSVGPESTHDEWCISKESMLPRHPGQPWLKPTFEQVSAGLENAATEWNIPMDPQPPRVPSRPLRKSQVKQPVFTGSVSTSGPRTSSVEQMPPKHLFQPWVSSTLQPQVSVGLETTATEGSISKDLKPSTYYSQSLTRPTIKQEVSDSMSASEERSAAVGPILSRHTFQSRANPKLEQQGSAGPESVAIEKDIRRELPKDLSQSTTRQKVQKMTSGFETAIVEGVKVTPSEGSLSPEHSTYLLVRSKVQKISSTPENTATEANISKKLLRPKSPSNSFVKFMAQQIFSENPDMQKEIYVDPRSPNLPSKSLLKAEIEHQIFSDWENADTEEGISLKHASKSLGRSADPQEGLLFSERAPWKWSHSKCQIPSRKASGKLKYQEEVLSVPDSSSEEWRNSEEQLPSRHPSKALPGPEFLPPTGLESDPVECSTLEEHRPHPSQAFGNAENQQSVHSSSKSAAAEGIISEDNPGAYSKGRLSSKRSKRLSQSSEDFTKSILTSATNPGKVISAPTWKVPISEDTYHKEEIRQSDDNDGYSYLFTKEANVENLSGARLKRPSSSRKYRSEKPNSFTQLPSFPISSGRGREHQMRRSVSQEFPNTTDSLTTPSTFVEKHQSRARYEGKSRRQSDSYTSDPAWFTMTRQDRKGSQIYIPAKETKTKSTAGAKTDTKEPRRGIRPETAQKTFQKGAGLASEKQPKKILISIIHRQEKKAQIKPSKSTTSVVFEDQKMLRTSGTGKEMKRSLSLPSGLQNPDELVKSNDPTEPVWFSIAKKKAKAWSHIADTMK
ncbi:PREDICTED: uncharacterized protein KIAA1210 homolog isoform X2 [Chinchilla lanigera]|uniref:KIAA1210 n=1 Tax=Chinchilla lanigera TaxID=34839 RepID=A0A8C2URH6_CHILA|nr:PREDICTED: uncharacterized protein KIAA1210 homolog isoform X2 [Chinchilla lanigera]